MLIVTNLLIHVFFFLDHSTKPYNATSFNEYVLEGSVPVLPETLRLFKKLISLGIKPVLLTGRC